MIYNVEHMGYVVEMNQDFWHVSGTQTQRDLQSLLGRRKILIHPYRGVEIFI